MFHNDVSSYWAVNRSILKSEYHNILPYIEREHKLIWSNRCWVLGVWWVIMSYGELRFNEREFEMKKTETSEPVGLVIRHQNWNK